MPFLKNIAISAGQDSHSQEEVPAALTGACSFSLEKNVTLFVGENGAGKTTLLEGIAEQCGFNLSTGGRNHSYQPARKSLLSSRVRLSWSSKVTRGLFLSAETFTDFISYIDRLAEDDPSILACYGGMSLRTLSHGEAFLALFEHQLEQGIYILDEPESALSPKHQLAFLSLIHRLETSGMAQFLIATHSPILLCYPRATLFDCNTWPPQKAAAQETEHVELTRSFLECPERYFRHLFE